ncbi:hypothetical protein ACFPOD_01035 [Nitratireductor kimnyeongensis]|uniref:Uncharacterized protein n=1 Tax=Nitratireductor kimnyeongensis TaxID=430679 RepID=A0ABW0T2W7_9HYPH|nr:hypothetical protein [Nitratireductor kimnyeongensis]QZZ35271.1 hypothetical protein KW403_16160 [Nitratireductor kimnyeongensis]
MSIMKARFSHMVLTALGAALLAGAPAYAENRPESEATQARDARIQRELDRSRNMLEDQHQEWMRNQRDTPRLTTPSQRDLNVPIYTSPPRLQ